MIKKFFPENKLYRVKLVRLSSEVLSLDDEYPNMIIEKCAVGKLFASNNFYEASNPIRSYRYYDSLIDFKADIDADDIDKDEIIAMYKEEIKLVRK